MICVIFLMDFTLSMVRAPSKRAYFINERGWLDLLGSLPSVQRAEAGGLLRLARSSRRGSWLKFRYATRGPRRGAAGDGEPARA